MNSDNRSQPNQISDTKTGSGQLNESTRKGPLRSGQERRKIKVPPPPGSPVRSGLDRRTGDRRRADFNNL